MCVCVSTCILSLVCVCVYSFTSLLVLPLTHYHVLSVSCSCANVLDAYVGWSLGFLHTVFVVRKKGGPCVVLCRAVISHHRLLTGRPRRIPRKRRTRTRTRRKRVNESLEKFLQL
ncbi:hypothetical protein V8C43DRAFT_293573 [Trichoderma afarasin]